MIRERHLHFLHLTVPHLFRQNLSIQLAKAHVLKPRHGHDTLPPHCRIIILILEMALCLFCLPIRKLEPQRWNAQYVGHDDTVQRRGRHVRACLQLRHDLFPVLLHGDHVDYRPWPRDCYPFECCFDKVWVRRTTLFENSVDSGVVLRVRNEAEFFVLPMFCAAYIIECRPPRMCGVVLSENSSLVLALDQLQVYC